MPRTVTIKAPAQHKGSNAVDTIDVTGTPVWLEVDGKRVRFLLQEGAQTTLTHYATGRTLGNLSARRLMLMASFGPSNIPPDRRIAQAMVDDIIVQNGIDKVLAEFARHPVLNP